MYLANLDGMTAGLILLAGCAAFLVWSGSAGERDARARQRSGDAITLPPPIIPYEFTKEARDRRS